jgi:tRNA A-37 threonylcarbamoyl transferase component Bud32
MSEQDETEPAPARPAGDSETIGPYQVLGSIGKGGMGEVLLARDPRLGRKVAIKRIRAEGGAESRLRFQREARLAASLSHPAIVPVYDLVVLGEHEHLVMELVEGPSLAQWLEENHGLDAKLQIAEQIAAGLAYAHRHGIVHRDLKTENVLLSADDQAKIADFGIARRNVAPLASTLDGSPETATELHTKEGALLGTYRSMSPEQARGEPADQRSDLFSFGVLLYEMFSGESPFRDASPLETLFRLTSKPHRPIRELAPELPAGLERLIDQLLEKDPELRPRSAQEALQQLKTLQVQLEEGLAQTLDSGTKAPLPAIPARSPNSPRAAWLRPWAALPAALVLLGGLGVWWWRPAPAGDPIYAAVLAPRFEGTAAQDGGADQQLGFSVRSGVLHRLSRLPGISPKTFGEVDQVQAGQGKAPTFRQIAEAAGADELVVPTIFCAGPDCSLRVDRWQLQGERTLGGDRRDLPAEGLDLAAQVAQHATSQLYPDHPLPASEEDDSFSLPAYNRLMEIRAALAKTRDSSKLDGWLDELRDLRQNHPGFHDLVDTEVEIEWRRFSELRDESSRARQASDAVRPGGDPRRSQPAAAGGLAGQARRAPAGGRRLSRPRREGGARRPAGDRLPGAAARTQRPARPGPGAAPSGPGAPAFLAALYEPRMGALSNEPLAGDRRGARRPAGQGPRFRRRLGAARPGGAGGRRSRPGGSAFPGPVGAGR